MYTYTKCIYIYAHVCIRIYTYLYVHMCICIYINQKRSISIKSDLYQSKETNSNQKRLITIRRDQNLSKEMKINQKKPISIKRDLQKRRIWFHKDLRKTCVHTHTGCWVCMYVYISHPCIHASIRTFIHECIQTYVRT